MFNCTQRSSNFFMDVQLDFGEEYGFPAVEMDKTKFKYAIFLALKILFGDMGCTIPVDILKYTEEDRRAFIRVSPNHAEKVWSSLSLFSKYDGLDCMFRIYKVAPVLACLMSNNSQEHKIKEKCSSR